VKLWSVAASCVIKQFALPPQAAAAITAYAISSLDLKGKKKGQPQQRTMIAVGTAAGAIVLFDATAGALLISKWQPSNPTAHV
jgi:hypothetical protein